MPAGQTACGRLVLYGLLRRGLPGLGRLGIEAALVWLGPCQVRGTLYDLGPYPGFSPEGGGLVAGDLFAIGDAAALARLDAFEDFRPEAPTASLFLRCLVRLHRPKGNAWIYVYNGRLGAAPVVASGDWLAHLSRR